MCRLHEFFARERAALILLILAVLLPRALTPAGWMPVPQDGVIRIAMCSGSGVAVIPLQRDHGQSAPASPLDKHPCSFAAPAMLGGDVPALLLAIILPASPAIAMRPDSIPIGRAAQLPPATGPPFTV